jgi:hypothetical protein
MKLNSLNKQISNPLSKQKNSNKEAGIECTRQIIHCPATQTLPVASPRTATRIQVKAICPLKKVLKHSFSDGFQRSPRAPRLFPVQQKSESSFYPGKHDSPRHGKVRVTSQNWITSSEKHDSFQTKRHPARPFYTRDFEPPRKAKGNFHLQLKTATRHYSGKTTE